MSYAGPRWRAAQEAPQEDHRRPPALRRPRAVRTPRPSAREIPGRRGGRHGAGAAGSALPRAEALQGAMLHRIVRSGNSRRDSAAPALRRSRARSSSAPLGLLAPERHARARGPRHEPVLVIVDVALDEAHRVPALDDPARRPEPSAPDGLEKIDLELERGEGFT